MMISPINDEVIKKGVVGELRWDIRINAAADIKVTVENGQVSAYGDLIAAGESLQ